MNVFSALGLLSDRVITACMDAMCEDERIVCAFDDIRWYYTTILHRYINTVSMNECIVAMMLDAIEWTDEEIVQLINEKNRNTTSKIENDNLSEYSESRLDTP